MNTATKKIGLALSGGGFRASLYHLGLVRFLRDAGILSQVSHITSVSGGSILAAHLVLNWDRYNGSPNDFDADGTVETVTDELQGLANAATEVTVDVEVVDGVGVVYNLQGLEYRSTDSSSDPTPTQPTPTQPSPTN